MKPQTQRASREYVIGIRAGLVYALQVAQMESEESKKVRCIRERIQAQIDELDIDIERMADD